MFDLHADRTFVVKDFRLTWEHGRNYLGSPYYPESGGTVLDLVNGNWGSEAGGEPDPSADPDEPDDLDLSDLDEDPDDRLPF